MRHILLTLAGSALAQAMSAATDRGDRIDQRLDNRGERIDNQLHRSGARIDRHFDRHPGC